MAEAAVEYWPMAYYGKKRRYLPCCHRPRPCGREEGGEEVIGGRVGADMDSGMAIWYNCRHER